nr:immunoglobulin light chain junction region [Macaca mulatta]MOW40979.1 immunoglobulin light chain junction region [Macaca mulatta]MOW41692.1 immunoglobulin light chain junction region [Macaca mulatta]MOW41695.1 immunoglobulin light chain junction region [Macaca mulatta]MOW42338.1 immunoglobulin light chain junction region [Macaca mulatta]
CMQGIELPWTF